MKVMASNYCLKSALCIGCSSPVRCAEGPWPLLAFTSFQPLSPEWNQLALQRGGPVDPAEKANEHVDISAVLSVI